MVEHLAVNQGVVGSSPTRGAKKRKHIFCASFFIFYQNLPLRLCHRKALGNVLFTFFNQKALPGIMWAYLQILKDAGTGKDGYSRISLKRQISIRFYICFLLAILSHN